jgi:hypothetical protein
MLKNFDSNHGLNTLTNRFEMAEAKDLFLGHATHSKRCFNVSTFVCRSPLPQYEKTFSANIPQGETYCAKY